MSLSIALENCQSGDASTEAVAIAISILEDFEFTNAGYGSNLNFEGEVECDALLMSGKDGHFGAIGACSGVKNPIQLAHKLLMDTRKGSLSLGRIRPVMLVGRGAWNYAKRNNIPCAQEEKDCGQFLVSPSACEKWGKYKKRLEQANEKEQVDPFIMQDTVGAVCVDLTGNFSAGVSSGGIAMKQMGRIGEAALFGAGCWASNALCCASSCSGTGESIMLSLLAKKSVELLSSEEMPEVALNTLFKVHLKSYLPQELNPNNLYPNYAGVIAVKKIENSSANEFEVAWVHNTQSFAVGYQSNKMKDAIAFVNYAQNNSKDAHIGVSKL